MRNKVFTGWLWIALFVVFTSEIIAQDRSSYKLLWEIEHKDSEKKSYLFGTIHLKDKRVFQFSDAVIPAIRNSELFALEVHPDSITDGYTERLFDTEVENIYRRVLSEEEYDRLDRRYRELQGEPLDSALFKNPVIIESILTEEVSKGDDKRTFLDGYLYGIAYSLNKDIRGLERFEDQLPALEDISDEEIRTNILSILDSEEGAYNSHLEEMIKLYYKGDVDEIYLRSVGLFTIDRILNDRNHVMANSIEKAMKTGSIFSAVGAAHLPGNEGIIEILRRKGFVVNPVEATFENDLEEFTIQPNLEKWVVDEKEEMGYRVMTPTTAAPLDYNEEIKVMMATDVIFGGVFGYMAIDLRGQIMNPDFDYVANVIEQQTGGIAENLIRRDSFERDGVEFTDLTMLTDEGHGRMMLAVANQIVYNFFVQHDLNELDTPYVNAFFDSVIIKKPTVAPTTYAPMPKEMGAFTVSMPIDVKDASRVVENPLGSSFPEYRLKIFVGEDKQKELVYVLRYNDQPLGYYMQNQMENEVYFTEYFNERGTVIGDPVEFTIGDYKGLEYELLLSDQYHTLARVFMRGNRTYVMLTQSTVPEKKVTRSNNLFNSFELTRYQSIPIDSIVTIDNRYSFVMPNEITKEIDASGYTSIEFDTSTTYMGIQEGTGGVYGLVHNVLKPYFYATNYDEFYENYVETLIEEGDSLIYDRKIKISGQPARDLLIHNNQSGVRQRMKLLLDNQHILLIQAYVNEEEMALPGVEAFLNSLEITQRKSTFDPFTRKSGRLMKALRSKDSLSFVQAKNALNYYQFEGRDVKSLVKALSHTFPYDSEYSTTEETILEVLLYMEDDTILDALSSYYKQSDTPYEDRVFILTYLFEHDHAQTAETFFDLVENHPPARVPSRNFTIFHGLMDSIPQIVTYQDRLKKLLEVENYRDGIVGLYDYAIRTDSTTLESLQPLGGAIRSYMKQDVSRYLDSLQRETTPFLNYGLMDDYIAILENTKDTSEYANEIIRLMYTEIEPASWLQTRALLMAIRSRFEVDQEILNLKMEDLYSRYEVMESLNKNDQGDQIPKQYLEPEAFSKLSLYNGVGEEYGYPDVIETLGTFTHQNVKYIAFGFGYNSEENERRYLGVSAFQECKLDKLQPNAVYWTGKELQAEWEFQAIQLLDEQKSN
ncbi:MAG: TraB/GumN family protein [Bacteroidota bacterium]